MPIKLMGVGCCVRPKPNAPVLTIKLKEDSLRIGWVGQAPTMEPASQAEPNPEKKDSDSDNRLPTQSTITDWEGTENKKGPTHRKGWMVSPPKSTSPSRNSQKIQIQISPPPTPTNIPVNEPYTSRPFDPLIHVDKSAETDHNADRVVLMSAERRDFSSILMSQVNEEQADACIRIDSIGAVREVQLAAP